MVNKVAMLFMLKISLGVDNVHIIKVGLNYEDAPIEIREKLTFSEETIEEAMLYLNTKKSMLENVIFSTCNRTEIYAVVDQIHVGRHQIKQFLEIGRASCREEADEQGSTRDD